MKGYDEGFGSRLRFARERWKLTQVQLAGKAGVGVATIRRMENGYFDPRFSTAQKLADALHVRVEWLLTGDSDVMVLPVHLTFEEQMKMRPPADSGHPDTVVFVGPGPWYQDESGEWRVSTRQNDDWSVTHL